MNRVPKTSPLVKLLRVIGGADQVDLSIARDVMCGEDRLKELSHSLQDQAWQNLANPFFDLLGAEGHREVTDAYDHLQGELRHFKRCIARIEKAAKGVVRFNERSSR
jgi:hypothetical protein